MSTLSSKENQIIAKSQQDVCGRAMELTPNRRQSPKYPLERLDLYGIYTTVRKPWSSKENKQIQLRFVDSI
jgi:hypothetical protein